MQHEKLKSISVALIATLLCVSALYAFGEKPKDTNDAPAQNTAEATSIDMFASFRPSIVSYLQTELGTKNLLDVKNSDGSKMNLPFDLQMTGVGKDHIASKEADVYYTNASFKLIDKKGKKTLYSFNVYAKWQDNQWRVVEIVNAK